MRVSCFSLRVTDTSGAVDACERYNQKQTGATTRQPQKTTSMEMNKLVDNESQASLNNIPGVELSCGIDKLACALIKARAAMAPLIFDAQSPHFRTRYASLAATLNTCVPALAEQGLLLAQFPCSASAQGHVAVVTMIVHSESGQYLGSRLELPIPRADAQGVGSAITYARRYALCAILGLAGEEDDDGNMACQKPAVKKPATRKSEGREPEEKKAQAKSQEDYERADLVRKLNFHLKAEGLKTPEAKRDRLSAWLGRALESISDVSTEELRDFVQEQDQIRF